MTPVAPDVALQAASITVRRFTIESRIARCLGKPALALLDEALKAIALSSEVQPRVMVELDRTREVDPAEALRTCLRLSQEAEADELLAAVISVKIYTVEALLRGGDSAGAHDLTRQLTTEWHARRPADIYWAEAVWIAYRAMRGAGDMPAAAALLQEAVDWIADTARSHVPEPFRDSFLQRNPINRDVLAEAGRLAAKRAS